MIGQSVGSDASPLSCFLFRPRKSCEKRRKRSHTNVSNASVTRTSSTSGVQTHPTSLTLLSQSPAKRVTGDSRYTLGFPRRIAHKRLTRRNRGRFGWGRYYYPRSVPHVSETLRGQVSERQTLPLLGLGRRCSRRTQRACGTAMRLCASLFRRRRGPAGLRDLFRFCRNSWICTPGAQGFPRVRGTGGITTLGALCVLLKCRTAACQKRLICRFLRLLSSILCAVPFSANMQISLSAISVANAFPPPTTAGLCASSRIASNRTTTVSLGCMDSSSFGCLIVLDSSSTYTTRS